MIAASVKDSERLVEFLLSKGADPNEKSEWVPSNPPCQPVSFFPADPFVQTTPARQLSTS